MRVPGFDLAFTNLSSQHTHDKTYGLDAMQRFALLSQEGIISMGSVEQLRSHSFLYVGAGSDIWLPLCLGARKLYLLDQQFIDPAKVYEVEQQLKRAGVAAEPIGLQASLRFPFHFADSGEVEDVEMHFIAGYYPQDSYQEWPQDAPNLPAPFRARYISELAHADGDMTEAGARLLSTHVRTHLDKHPIPPLPSDITALLAIFVWRIRLDGYDGIFDHLLPGARILSTNMLEFNQEPELLLDGRDPIDSISAGYRDSPFVHLDLRGRYPYEHSYLEKRKTPA